MNIKQVHKNLQQYIEKENFSGYDPYDTLKSFIPFHKLGKWPPVLAIQFQKRNPLNIRPLLGIKKESNPKALGLLLQAYSLLFEKYKTPEYLVTAHELFDRLCECTSKGQNYYCWGYNFPWASSEKYLPRYSPTSVVTGFICRGIYKYYKISENPKAAEVLKSAAQFVLNDIHRYTDETGIAFSYTSLAPDVCYNASLLAAEILLYDQLANGNNHHVLLELACFFVVNKQQENGVWNYSYNLKTKTERKQIDFHQGYVIDSLYNINQIIKNISVSSAIQKGVDFYFREQFTDEGQSLYRLPEKYPVDIHNQTQGILTASLLINSNKELSAIREKILNYTISNLKHKKGYFYYRKYRNYSITIPYMRWSEAWMFLALTVYRLEQ